ncbi:integrase catalytic domain-containing protein [Trichonephila clavipes]|nr:integrase catalytic domain-containing protein [Trichonephila clavipes]
MNRKIDELKDQYYDIKDISESELQVIEADIQSMEDILEELEVKIRDILNYLIAKSSVSSVHNHENAISQANSKLKLEIKLPKIPLPVFRASLQGDAKLLEAVDDSFESLITALKTRFENKRLLTEIHINALLEVEKLTSESTRDIRTMTDILNRETGKQFEQSIDSNQIPELDTFITFLEKRSQTIDNINRSAPITHKPKQVPFQKGEITLRVKQKVNTVIQNKNGDFSTPLELLIVQYITTTSIHRMNEIKVNIPSNIDLADKDFGIPAEKDKLIGCELFFELLRPNKFRSPCEKWLFQETVFGYIVVASFDKFEEKLYCGLAINSEINSDNLNQQLQAFLEIKRVDESSIEHSLEEEICETQYQNTHCRTEEGRYVVQLPLKKDPYCLEWDEPLSNPIAKEWNDFVSTLPVIQNIHVPRLVIGKGRTIIHGFADASTAAYGAVLYAQSISEEDVSTRILCSKSRVEPVKPITIPRLELCACVLLSQLLEKVLHSLTLPIQQKMLWTDSNIVLAWIQRSPEQLKTFFGIKIIQRLTQNCQWDHVSSNENPADLISRGLSASDISSKQLWWHGPDFLREELEANPIDFKRITSDSDYLKEIKPANSFK